MPLPKQITWVTFSVYGTLIDIDTGVYEAFEKEASKDGIEFKRDELLDLFYEKQKEVQAKSYELYAEVLRRTAVEVADELGWQLEPVRSSFLPDSIPYWKPFKEATKELERIKKKHSIGYISNIDDKLLGISRRHLPVDLDLVVTAQQVRSYKPDPAHFKELQRRIGSKKGWVHIADNPYYDIEPCLKGRIPVIWVNRKKEEWPGKKKPDAEVANLREAAKLVLA